MSEKLKSRPDHLAIQTLWPYAAFLLLVALYSFFTLGHGFNATDEGYLLAIGQRVADGETPYVDFYFFRTPLSVYIQALFIKVFGESYKVLLSRVMWTIQLCLVAIMISLLYRRCVRHWELLVLLTTSFTVSTLLMIFPWYSYDALFFAVLSVVFWQRRQWELAGLAAFLAFMCKQNYAVLLPAYFFLGAIIQRYLPDMKLITARWAVRAAAGFVVPMLVYGGYLLTTGALDEFIKNVLTYPRQASQVSIWFVVFQNHAEIIYLTVPAIVAAASLFYLYTRHKAAIIIALAASIVAVVLMFQIHHNFIYALMYVNFAVTVLTIVHLIKKKAMQTAEAAQALTGPAIFGLIIQYAAGFNYAGVVLAYMGSGLSLVLVYIFFRDLSPAPNRRVIAIGVLAVLLAGGLYHKYTYVYRDVPRSSNTVEFATEKLRGIESSARNTRQIDELVRAARRYTGLGEYMLVFPDMPVLYYLADRKNPTPVGWYVQLEFGNWLMDDILESLKLNMPGIIFVQRYFELDFERAGALIDYASIPRYRPIVSFIDKHYQLEGNIGDVMVFLPRNQG